MQKKEKKNSAHITTLLDCLQWLFVPNTECMKNESMKKDMLIVGSTGQSKYFISPHRVAAFQ